MALVSYHKSLPWIRKALAMLVGAAASFAACAAHAAEHGHRPNVVVPVMVYAGGNLADYLTTRGALARGALEANPVVRWSGLDTAKAASTAALVFLDMRLQRRSKVAPWILRGLTAGTYVFVAHHNHRTSRGSR